MEDLLLREAMVFLRHLIASSLEYNEFNIA